ncbi:MAG: CRISPR-associated endonuclease Cas2, partial [Pseudomonadota bacterium]
MEDSGLMIDKIKNIEDQEDPFCKEFRYMWIFVFFDLPVKEKKERRAATQFRNFLLKDGYMMIQWSVYARVCNGQVRVEKHTKRLQHHLPARGNIRLLQITDKQYSRMK